MNGATKAKIKQTDKAFPHEAEEKNLKELINKRRGIQMRNDLIHTVNQLHVKDSQMVKRDLQNDIRLINENYERLLDPEGEGWDFFEEKLGIKKEKLMVNHRTDPSFQLNNPPPRFDEVRKKRIEEQEEALKNHNEIMD